MLLAFLFSLGISALVTYGVVRAAQRYRSLLDHDISGPQRLQQHAVLRIGGVGIAAGLTGGLSWLSWRDPAMSGEVLGLILAAAPAFVAGLYEDLSRRLRPRVRIVATVVSGFIGMTMLGALITRTDIPGLDLLTSFPLGAIALTLFTVAGVSHAVNIIDGLNGLASMCVVIMLSGLIYVAADIGDHFVTVAALCTMAAALGFFVWNYPRGSIFLGDGGAYLLGVLLVLLCILLIVRNPAVSPIFGLLLAAYPIVETVFSMYRRRIVRGRPISAPDGIHLHTLLYRRRMHGWGGSADAATLVRRNSATAPYLWALCLLSVVPATLWWSDTRLLAICLGLFVVFYIGLYRRIVYFRTPGILLWRR